MMKRGMIRTWLRTLLLQASWNYERLVGVGVAFSSEPLLRDLPGGRKGERYRAAMGRAAQYFNGHPYLIGLAIGALARMEHEGLPAEQMDRLRTALTGPLGSVGDKLVWAGILPTASGLALILTIMVSPVVGVASFLVVYNVVHFALRGWGLAAGWRGGIGVAQKLGTPLIKTGLKVAGPMAALSLGLALPIVGEWLVRHVDGPELLATGIVALVGILLARWIWPTLGANRYGLAVVAVVLILGWL
jgi:PTS system mannose-specific IID component